jgi:hypothetical protein
MKKTVVLLGAALAIISIACDKVKNPVQSEQVIVSNKNVLIEDYTGQQCGNCPNAAHIAEQLEEKYGSHVIVIAVHAGSFAKTSPAPFVTSYTCQAGVDWDAASGGFGISSGAGNPNGLVNRKNDGSGLILKETKWASAVAKYLQEVDLCDMWITTKFNTTDNTLNTTVKTKFKKSYGANTKLSVVFTEDSIIGPQKDYTLPPGSDIIPNYVFNNMLRGAINTSWGEPLKNVPINYNDSVTVSYNNFPIDTAKFKTKRLSVVAFVYNASTREILEVEKVKMIK